MWSDLPPELVAERLEILAAAYGRLTAREILHAVVPRSQLAVDAIRQASNAGTPAC